MKYFTPLSLEIKWPNDLFYRGKKVGGILNISSVVLNVVNIIQATGKIRIIIVDIITIYKIIFIKVLFMIIFIKKMKVKKGKY